MPSPLGSENDSCQWPDCIIQLLRRITSTNINYLSYWLFTLIILSVLQLWRWLATRLNKKRGYNQLPGISQHWYTAIIPLLTGYYFYAASLSSRISALLLSSVTLTLHALKFQVIMCQTALQYLLIADNMLSYDRQWIITDYPDIWTSSVYSSLELPAMTELCENWWENVVKTLNENIQTTLHYVQSVSSVANLVKPYCQVR